MVCVHVCSQSLIRHRTVNLVGRLGTFIFIHPRYCIRNLVLCVKPLRVSYGTWMRLLEIASQDLEGRFLGFSNFVLRCLFSYSNTFLYSTAGVLDNIRLLDKPGE